MTVNPLGHNDAWFEQRNAALGLPHGTRHNDAWYQQRMQQHAAAQARDQATAFSGQKKEAQSASDTWIGQQQHAHQAAPPPPPTGPTSAELAAAEADRQGKMRARRDEWDQKNNQGAYDPDGWQSIGYQPDPVGMPSWWLDGLELGTTAPAVPPVTPPAAPSINALFGTGVVPPVTAGLTPSAGSLFGTGAVPPVTAGLTPPAPSINALFGTGVVPPVTAGLTPASGSLFGTGAVPPVTAGLTPGNLGFPLGRSGANALGTGGQAQNAQPAGQGGWGSSGQGPSFRQKPDAGAWGSQKTAMAPVAQPWTQPAWAQGQKPGMNPAGPQPWMQPTWRQKPAQAGTWRL